ncbi:MAG: SLC13 family permease [Parvularcula sp.]
MNEAAQTGGVRRTIGLTLGPILAIGLQWLGPSEAMVAAVGSADAARDAWVVLSLLCLMAVWWVTEALPIPATSLLPLVVLPFFGVLPVGDVSADYMHPVVVLLLGGFIFAKTLERWELHRRIALNVVARSGSHPTALVGGFMVAGALLSMWISNTATSIMMMPIAMSVATAVAADEESGAVFARALLLGIAYACSIGGLGTPVGTPTNLIVIGYLNEEGGYAIDFAKWMMIGIPAVLLLLPMAWFVLTRWSFPIGQLKAGQSRAVISEELRALGPMTTPEVRTMLLFLLVAGLWVFKGPLKGIEVGGVVPFSGLTDSVTAVLGAVLAFLIPAGGQRGRGRSLLDWSVAETIPWGVLLLFGGGMALAGAIRASGLGIWLGGELASLATLPTILLMLIIAASVVFITEVTSNVATAAALTPVLGAMALATGLDIALVIAPLALAASCAFMLPMATGPNAVAYATGKISIPAMAGAGFRINLLAIPLITLVVYFIAPFAFSPSSP